MEDDDQFEFVENNEAEKTSYLLLENEFRLYQGDNGPECPEEDGEEDDQYGMKRYYSEGYEANVYKADDKELMEWRDLFHCMHVVGEGITNEVEEMPTSIYQPNSTPHPPPPNTHLEVANILKSNEAVLWKEIISDLSGYVKHTVDAADRLNISTDLKELDKPPVQEYSDDFW